MIRGSVRLTKAFFVKIGRKFLADVGRTVVREQSGTMPHGNLFDSGLALRFLPSIVRQALKRNTLSTNVSNVNTLVIRRWHVVLLPVKYIADGTQ